MLFTTRNSDGERYFDDQLKKLIEQNRNIEIKHLLNNSTPRDLMDSTGATLLHLSAKYNNHLLTKYLIKRAGCEIEARDNNGATPLLIAATFNSFKSAAVLLDANADVCAANNSGRTALQLFLSVKRKVPAEIVNRCLERAKNSSECRHELANKLINANCPLELVVLIGIADVTEVVLERDESIDDVRLLSALYVAMKAMDLDNVKVLLERVKEVSICKMELLEFIVHVSVKKPTKKGLQIFDNLLAKVNDWESLNENVMSFIENILENAPKDSVKILIERNVDSHVREVFPDRELLAHIFANHHVGTIELLQKRSFDVNCRGKSGNTPLKLAVKNRVVRNVQLLLDMNADPNISDDDGWVPLFEALSPKKVELDDKKCVELLLQYGAEVQVVDKCGQTIVDWALINGDFALLEPVLAHLAILEMLGQSIMIKIKHQIGLFRHLKVCYETYKKQLERMKLHEICGNVTLFTVLTDDSEKISPKVKNQKNIARLLQSNSVRKFHWYYVSTLKKRFEQANEISLLRVKAAMVLAQCVKQLETKNTVVERIVGYLNYCDLYAFAQN